MARTSKTMLNNSGESDILALFLILEEMLSVFHHWEWCLLWVCRIWPLLCWERFPLCPLSGDFFIINVCWILSKVFSASIEMIIWFFFFSLLMWCITLIDLHILKNPCIPGINPTWSWCMILISFHSFFFILFRAVNSTILSSRSLIHSSASVILLLIPSSVFFISIIVLFISVHLFFNSSRSLLNISCIFSIFASILFPRSWIIFIIIILNSFSGRLPISTSFSCFSLVLSCYFIWYTALCLFILSIFLWMGFCSTGCRIVALLASAVSRPLLLTSTFYCLPVFVTMTFQMRMVENKGQVVLASANIRCISSMSSGASKRITNSQRLKK